MARRTQRIDRGIHVRSDSIYALSSWSEITYLIAPRVLFAGTLLLLPIILASQPYWSRVMLSACLIALLGIGFDFLANHVGLVCLGGAFFYGVGGYMTAWLDRELGLPTVLSIPLAAVLGAVVCTLVLAPCLRLRGIYFSVVTLMVPLLMVRLIEATDILGGTEGLRGLDGFASPWLEQYALIVALLVAVFGLRRFVAEDPGLVLRAIRDNDQSVRASGISVAWGKARSVAIAAFLGCFAGAYYAQMYHGVGVSSFALDLSILPVAVTLVGGAGTLVGSVVASLLLVPLGELLRDFGSLRIVAYALILTAAVVFRSEGLLPFVTRKVQQFERTAEV